MDVVRRHLEQVLVDDDEVGQLAGFERAEAVFAVPGVGGVEREAAERLFQRHRLVRVPAGHWLALRILARDGGVQAEERVRCFDREVRAAGDTRTLVQEGAPRISALDALGADAGFGHVFIRRRVGRLHRRDDADRLEARDVARLHDLRVLDAVTLRAALGCGDFFLVDVEDLLVAGVANRMHVDLVTAAHRLRHHGVHLPALEEQQAVRMRVIAVRLDQRRAAAAQRAVRIQLDGAQCVHAVAVVVQRAVLGQHIEVRAGAADHAVHARRQLARIGVGAVQAVLGHVHARVVHAGQAHARQFAQGAIEHRARFGLGLRRQHFGQQILRRVDQDAGRFAIRVTHDLAADRVRRGFRDAGQRQRAAVGPAGVAVDAFEPHRPVADDGVEFGGGGEAAQLPVFLVPAAPAQPWVPRIGACVLADRLQCAGQRGAVEQVELRQLLAQAEHVAVGVDQAGQQRAATHVDAFGLRRLGRDIRAGAHGDDAARVVKGERGELHQVALGVEGIAVGVVDQGRGVGWQAAGNGQDDQGTQGGQAGAHAWFSPSVGIPRLVGAARESV